MHKIKSSGIIFVCLLFSLSACVANEKVHQLNISKSIKVEIHEKNIDMGANKNNLPNGNIVFGSTTGNPKTYISKILFTVNNTPYILENKYMYNSWGNRPLEIPNVIKYFDAHCYDNTNCTIRGIFSDAAGSFVAEWKIINGKPTRTMITDSNDILNLFSKNISPPAFD